MDPALLVASVPTERIPTVKTCRVRTISRKGWIATSRVTLTEKEVSRYVDGEGSFSVSVQRNATCRVGFQLVPEFHVSQNGDRSQVLSVIRERFGGCGYIKPNGRKDRALVYVVRRREHLLEHVIPFFERTPLMSSKQEDFGKFAAIVRSMALGHHRTASGFSRLLDEALSMNGNGRFRSVRWKELLAAVQNPQRLYAEREE